jgi:hypothetical protein
MSKSIRRMAVVALSGAIAGLMLLPATGQAATIFGSQLKNDPTENSCEMFGPCTIVAHIHSVPPEGDPYSGGAPVGGVITSFRTNAYAVEDSGQITFRLANLTLPDPMDLDNALATAAGTGPTITIVPEEDGELKITEVAARLPVQPGQQLAVDISPSIAVIYNSNGDKRSYLFASPQLKEGEGQRASNEVLNELQVQATIEPDADNDGFGDETQDQCPTQATTQGPCDTSAPGVTGLKVAGAKVSYKLSEAATVRFKLEKKSKGRKVGKKCVKQTQANKTKKPCPRFKQIKSFSGPGAAGNNKATIPGGKNLKPGSYRLTMTATDAAGNQTTKTTSFKVAAKKKGKKKK